MINLAGVDRHDEQMAGCAGDAAARFGRHERPAGRLTATASGSNDAQFKRFTELDTGLIEAVWHVADGRPDDSAKNEAFEAAQRAHETQAGAALAQMAARFGAGNDAIASVCAGSRTSGPRSVVSTSA